MAETELRRSEEETWPAVGFAYDFVFPSYQMMASRVEAMATRIQAIMTFAATVSLGFPVLGQAVNKTISFWSAPFLGAIALFVILMCFGVIVRDFGEFMVVSPSKVYATSLHLSEWEFKRDAIHTAGRCFDHNSALANRKAELAKVMSVLLLLEVLCFLAWIARGV
jgi:uncharacterized membrane protein YadS